MDLACVHRDDVAHKRKYKSKCEPLIHMGAKYQSSPEGVAVSCDNTFAMLANPENAMDVAYGNHDAANEIGPGK